MALMFSPNEDRLLIERVPEEETTKGGTIIIPDNAREKPVEGVVVAAGPGRVTDYGVEIPTRAKQGDHVLFGRYSGSEITIEDRPMLIMREGEILGWLHRTPDADPGDGLQQPGLN